MLVQFDLERWPCSEIWLIQGARIRLRCYHKSIHSGQVDDTMISAKWSYIIVKSVAGAYTLLQSSCLYPNPSFVSRCPRQLYFCETLVGQHPACSHCQTPQSTINELINRDLTNVRVTRDVPWLGQILGENRSLLRSFPTKRKPRSIVKHLFIPPVSIYLERTIFTS